MSDPEIRSLQQLIDEAETSPTLPTGIIDAAKRHVIQAAAQAARGLDRAVAVWTACGH